MNWWNQYVSANVAELTGKSPICVVFGGESWWKSPECAVSRGAFQMVPLQQLLIQHCMPAPTDPPHHSGCQTTPESRSSNASPHWPSSPQRLPNNTRESLVSWKLWTAANSKKKKKNSNDPLFSHSESSAVATELHAMFHWRFITGIHYYWITSCCALRWFGVCFSSLLRA